MRINLFEILESEEEEEEHRERDSSSLCRREGLLLYEMKAGQSLKLKLNIIMHYRWCPLAMVSFSPRQDFCDRVGLFMVRRKSVLVVEKVIFRVSLSLLIDFKLDSSALN